MTLVPLKAALARLHAPIDTRRGASAVVGVIAP
jgi:hypothetical protein